MFFHINRSGLNHVPSNIRGYQSGTWPARKGNIEISEKDLHKKAPANTMIKAKKERKNNNNIIVIIIAERIGETRDTAGNP